MTGGNVFDIVAVLRVFDVVGVLRVFDVGVVELRVQGVYLISTASGALVVGGVRDIYIYMYPRR